jgi:predicted anti-sigma-YlaC factor YlaD
MRCRDNFVRGIFFQRAFNNKKAGTMKCAQIRKYSERYKDGDVSPVRRVKIASHVTTCEACKAAFEDMKAIGVMFSRTAAPAIPEGVHDAILEKIGRTSHGNATKRKEEYPLAGWWATAQLSVRIAYSLVLLVLMAIGIYMGGDLWKNKVPTTVAASYDSDYPGIDAFVAMQAGSIEQTYFELTSTGNERGNR